MLASPAHAATYTVNSPIDTDDGACSADPGGCTLREAINAANSSSGVADTIDFTAPRIVLSSQLPLITDMAGLTIDVGDALGRADISGDNRHENFLVDSGAGLTLNRLRVVDAGSSSAVSNLGGTLTVSNFTFSGNSAAIGGAISVQNATADFTNSTFSGNTAETSPSAARSRPTTAPPTKSPSAG